MEWIRRIRRDPECILSETRNHRQESIICSSMFSSHHQSDGKLVVFGSLVCSCLLNCLVQG